MIKPLYRSALACSVLVIAMAGCSKSSSDKSSDDSSSDTTAASTTTSVVAQDQSALPALPKAQTLDLQANHPNGTVIHVTAISFHDDHMEVQLTATNGNTRVTNLGGNDTLLRDDQNIAYRVSAPPSNPTLQIPAGVTQEYKLVFLGRISPKATSLTLHTNEKDTFGGITSEYTSSPNMSVGPIPVVR